jgi:hypothetical protein
LSLSLENKLKIFKWKLLQFIIPTKSHLFKWKISTDSLCNVCKVEEDYDHFFMSCKYLDIFWNKINEMLKKVQFENNIKLQHLIFGYKIFDKEYFHLNYFLTILAFTIYKSYYVFRVQVPLKYPCEILFWIFREILNTIITYKTILF